MRYFYDTEFYEDGDKIHLISIGVVGEDGSEYYAEADFSWSRVPSGHWLWENVWPHLNHDGMTARDAIARELHQFITKNYTEVNNELWAYYADYDHVVLCRLFGRMIDLPPGIPMCTFDIQQEYIRLKKSFPSLTLPKQDSQQHNALNDAKWNKEAWNYLKEVSSDWSV